MDEKLKELRGKLEERRKRLHDIFEQAGPDLDMGKVSLLDGDSTAKVAGIKALNDEIDDLAKQAEPFEAELAELERARRNLDRLGQVERHPGHAGGKHDEAREFKGLGTMLIESDAYKQRLKGGVGPVSTLDLGDRELKTLFQISAGWDPFVPREARVIEDAQRPILVTQIFPTGATGTDTISYMEETTFTSNAAEVAEAGTYGEAALALTERTSAVRKIGVWLPVTDEQLDDVAQAESYVNQRLPFMLRQRLDGQLLVGNGTAPNLRGLNNVTGIQTQAKGADPVPDAVHKAITLVLVTGRASPTHTIWHPNDWEGVRLLRTADGIYIWGNPSEAGPERIWGLPVVKSDAQTENTAIVVDVGFTQLFTRRGVDVQVGFQSDDFIKGRKAIRADTRVAFVAYRAEAICTVTGI